MPFSPEWLESLRIDILTKGLAYDQIAHKFPTGWICLGIDQLALGCRQQTIEAIPQRGGAQEAELVAGRLGQELIGETRLLVLVQIFLAHVGRCSASESLECRSKGWEVAEQCGIGCFQLLKQSQRLLQGVWARQTLLEVGRG